MPEVAPVIRAVLEVREGRSDSFSRRGGIVVDVEGGDDDDNDEGRGERRKRREKGAIYSTCTLTVLQGRLSWIQSLDLLLQGVECLGRG